jgi:hypothetical protein
MMINWILAIVTCVLFVWGVWKIGTFLASIKSPSPEDLDDIVEEEGPSFLNQDLDDRVIIQSPHVVLKRDRHND